MAITEEQINIRVGITDDTRGKLTKIAQDLNLLNIGGPKTPLEIGVAGYAPTKSKAMMQALAKQERERAKAQRQILFSGLGTLFFFQQMSRILGGFLQPAAEAAGVFEIISLIFELLFLPVMLALLPILLKVLNVIISLPEELKLLIGVFTLVAFVLSSIIAFGAQLALFISSLGGARTLVSALTGAIGALVAALSAPVILILALIASMALLLIYRDQVVEFFNSIKDALANLLGLTATEKTVSNQLEQIIGGPGAQYNPMFGVASELATKAVGAVAGQETLQNISVFITNALGIQSNVSVEQLSGNTGGSKGVVNTQVT